MVKTVLKKIMSQKPRINSIPYMEVFISDQSYISLQNTVSPCIYFILNKTLKLNTINGVNFYHPGEYFISTITTPLVAQISGKQNEGNFVSVSIELDTTEILSVMMNMDAEFINKILKNEIRNTNSFAILSCISKIHEHFKFSSKI